MRVLALAAGIGIAGALAGPLGIPALLEPKGFDLLTAATQPAEGTLPVVLVGIDDASFAELELQWPWPRGLHARLVDSLSEAGAAVIAFDLVFDTPSEPAEDEALAAALERAGNVVLAASASVQETPHGVLERAVLPLPVFEKGAAGVGFVDIPLDGDTVVRRLPPSRQAFWRAILRRFAEVTGAAFPPPPEGEALLRYAGRDHTFPYVSYYQALRAGEMLPAGSFEGAVAIVGHHAEVAAGAAGADLFATPFTAFTGALTPGVEVHATALETVASGRAIRPVGRGWALTVLALSLLAGAAMLARWRPWWSLVCVAGLAGLLASVALLLFAHADLWLPVLTPVAGLALLYLGQGTFTFVEQARERRWLEDAFSRYVSPQLVERILLQPERPRLGGERRDLTVLFADLAGFTSLSESRQPEEVVQLLNRCLTEIAGILHAHGGTIDKFIGDAVMAFWNAPLDDPEHALHGCRAAVALAERMASLRDELAAEGLPALALRVGVHSGQAVVGNMGSEERFDYTAVGDTVNLASRLEGVNKLYGTEVMVSGATAARLAGELLLRPVDRVRVKGKTQAVDIFSPTREPVIARLSDEALAATRSRSWAKAEKLWQNLLERFPTDPVASIHVGRLASLRRDPPPPEWDGFTALEKM